MPIVYTEVSKPLTPSYTEIEKTEYTIDFLFQDGEDYLFQDGVQKVFAANINEIYSIISKPSAPIYVEIVKPT